MLSDQEIDELKEKLEEAFSDYYELAGGKNYRYHHLVRTHRYVKKLIKREEVQGLEFDPEVVEVAALFHDIGRKEDIEDGYLNPMDEDGEHADRGAEIVSGYIEEFLDEEQVEKVEKVIGNHHSRPETVEGEIVQDCDALSNFGINNMWRMIHYSADKERTVDESLEYFWDEALDAYREKLQDFNLEVAKLIAKERVVRHQETVLEMEKEVKAEDI
ncbi:MAG: HD domain-containing protein [Candidatus Nanohalobium sp.]